MNQLYENKQLVKVFPCVSLESKIDIEEEILNDEIINIIENIKSIKTSTIKFAPNIHIVTKSYIFAPENKQDFISHFSTNELTYQNKFKETFISFCINSECTFYKKSILNILQFSHEKIEKFENGESIYEEEEENNLFTQKYFITSYSLIKQFIDKSIKDFTIYLIPSKKGEEIDQIFTRLNNIVKNIKNRKIRIQNFNELIYDYNLEVLEVNQKSLLFRQEFINFTNKENLQNLFKDTISKELIFPILDILLLDYNKSDQLENSKVVTNIINSNFIEKLNKNKANENFNFISFFSIDDLNKKVKSEIENENDSINLFVNKEFSANFGRIISSEDLIAAKFNFNPNLPGSLIYDMNFIPIGIVSTTKYKDKNDYFGINNYNFILPFSHPGVIHLFKKVLQLDFDFDHLRNSKKKENNLFEINKIIKLEEITNLFSINENENDYYESNTTKSIFTNRKKKFNFMNMTIDDKDESEEESVEDSESDEEDSETSTENGYKNSHSKVITKSESYKKKILNNNPRRITPKESEELIKIINNKYNSKRIKNESLQEYCDKIKAKRENLILLIDKSIKSIQEKIENKRKTKRIRKIAQPKKQTKKNKLK